MRWSNWKYNSKFWKANSFIFLEKGGLKLFGINNNRKEQELVRTMILEEKIRLYPFKDVYRVYGDTFENRAALKK